MRAGSKQPDSAELRKHKTKAGASGGQYKENYHLEDLILCVRIYTKKYRLGERRPGFKKLQETYGVPATSIQNAVQRKDFYRDRDVSGQYEKDNDGKFIWRPREVPLEWNDPDIYDVKPGAPAQVPPEIMTLLVGLLSEADDPEILNGASRGRGQPVAHRLAGRERD